MKLEFWKIKCQIYQCEFGAAWIADVSVLEFLEVVGKSYLLGFSWFHLPSYPSFLAIWSFLFWILQTESIEMLNPLQDKLAKISQ